MGTTFVRRKGSRIRHGEKLNCNAVATEALAISSESSGIVLQSLSCLKASVNVDCPHGM